MNWVALKMLTGDKGKYLGIVFGVSFAALLMAQQSAIFCGLMRNTTSQIRDIQGGDLWVMDKNVQFVDDTKPLSENALYRVRGVEGVRWAVRLYKGMGPWAWAIGCSRSRISYPAGSSSAWPSPARSSTSRACSCATNRRRRSMPRAVAP